MHNTIALYSYWFTWQQRPHHFANALGKLGYRVELFSTRSVADYFRSPIKQKSDDSLAVHFGKVRPVFPSPRFDRLPLVSKFNGWQRRSVMNGFYNTEADIHVYAAVPFETPTIKPPILIYDCMDDWSDFPALPETVIENERRLCEMADRIWVVSKHIYHKFSGEYGAKLDYVPNGVDYDHFATTTHINVPRTRPTLGYVGALHSWFDTELVAAVADKLPNWDINLVGPIMLSTEQRQNLERPNIHFFGRQAYQALPRIMAGFDVSMIPFVLTDLINGTSPIKLYEYLAAGLPVVSTSMPEVLPFREPGVVICADSPDEFAQGILDLYHANSTEMLARRQQVARHHTWQERFQQALQGIGQP